ncbi:MAG: c-type cytochrome [Verrucomicrobia bacterium]|nr:c-type cytochrome [Verrucomicrobiota bacterium]
MISSQHRVFFVRPFVLCLLSVCLSNPGPLQSQDADRTAVMVEALLKLENPDLSSNARLKEIVESLAQKTTGTADFVRLVKKFRLQDRSEGLLQAASTLGASDAGAEAIRLLISGGNPEALLAAATGEAPRALQILRAIGAASDARSVSLLTNVVTSAKATPEARKEAVRAASRIKEGAGALVKLAEADLLPPDTRFTAQTELSTARWPEIKTAAAKLLPPPSGSSSEPLPPISELIKAKGNPVNGRAMFFGKATCSTCHQIKKEGIHFGPDLSQIGTKLGKDALYESILDPSSGVSFGYEAWLVTLKSEEEAFGLVASETETDLSIRAPGGVVTNYKKSEIQKREQQKLSIMPAGLQATMSRAELTDLIEFLASLR